MQTQTQKIGELLKFYSKDGWKRDEIIQKTLSFRLSSNQKFFQNGNQAVMKFQMTEQEYEQKLKNQQRNMLLVFLTDTLGNLKSDIYLKFSEEQNINFRNPKNPFQILQLTYNQLYQQTQQQLDRIQRYRKKIQKIQKNINQSQQTKIKKITRNIGKKNNLKNYLECLEKLRIIRLQFQQAKTEEEIEKINKQISLNGYVVGAELLEKNLQRVAYQTIYDKGLLLKIQSRRNLEIIINTFMTPKKNRREQETNQQQGLYNLCKNFLKLRILLAYVPINQYEKFKNPQKIVSEVCCSKITHYVSKYSYLITKKQYHKVRSLCQASNELAEFIDKLFSELQNINTLQIQSKINYFENQLNVIKSGTSTNVGITSFISQFQEEDFIQFYQMIQQRCWIYSHQKSEMVIENTIDRLLRILYFPLLYMVFMAINGEYDSKEGRRYQKIRLIYRHINLFKKMFSNLNINQSDVLPEKVYTLKPKLPETPKIKELKNGLFLKQLTDFLYEKAKQSKMKYKDINDTAVEYNQKFGGTALFLINKLTILKAKSNMQEQKQIRNLYLSLWVQIIAQLCFGSLKFSQQQCRYPLKNLKFFQERIINQLNQKFGVQGQMDLIRSKHCQYSKTLKKKYFFQSAKNKNDKENYKEKLYSQLMNINIKTCQYEQLMSLAKFIGEEVVVELISGHRSLYYSIFK